MPDVKGALLAMHQCLRPDGRLATAVWSTPDKMPLTTIGAEAVRKIAGLPPPPPDALGPLRLADESKVREMLAAAGFRDVTVERIPVTFELDSAADFAQFRVDVAAPFRMLLERQPAPIRAKLIEAVIAGAGAYADASGRVRTVNETICYAATH